MRTVVDEELLNTLFVDLTLREQLFCFEPRETIELVRLRLGARANGPETARERTFFLPARALLVIVERLLLWKTRSRRSRGTGGHNLII